MNILLASERDEPSAGASRVMIAGVDTVSFEKTLARRLLMNTNHRHTEGRGCAER